MRLTKPGFFVLMVFLAAALMVPLLFSIIASADCGGSVSSYGQCFYRDGLLVCGTCAVEHTESGATGCDRCGAGYRCQANNCALSEGCADTYSCDLCGCSWGKPTSAMHHGTQ